MIGYANDNDADMTAEQSRIVAKFMADAENNFRILAQFSKLLTESERLSHLQMALPVSAEID